VFKGLIQFHHRRYVSSTTATANLHTRVKMATHLNVAISFTVLSTKAKSDFKFVPLRICSFVLSPDATSETPKFINCARNNENVSERTRQRLMWTKRHKTSANSVSSSYYPRLYHPHCLVHRRLPDTHLVILRDSLKYLIERRDA